jgi:hypothetical protein
MAHRYILHVILMSSLSASMSHKETTSRLTMEPALVNGFTWAWSRYGYRTSDGVVEPILVPITSPDTINSTRRFC